MKNKCRFLVLLVSLAAFSVGGCDTGSSDDTVIPPSGGPTQYTLEVAVLQMEYSDFMTSIAAVFIPATGDKGTDWAVVKGANAVLSYTALSQVLSSYAMDGDTATGTYSEIMNYKDPDSGIGVPQALKNRVTENDIPIAGVFEPTSGYVAAFYLHK